MALTDIPFAGIPSRPYTPPVGLPSLGPLKRRQRPRPAVGAAGLKQKAQKELELSAAGQGGDPRAAAIALQQAEGLLMASATKPPATNVWQAALDKRQRGVKAPDDVIALRQKSAALWGWESGGATPAVAPLPTGRARIRAEMATLRQEMGIVKGARRGQLETTARLEEEAALRGEKGVSRGSAEARRRLKAEAAQQAARGAAGQARTGSMIF